ncbi:imidazole glycerol phosphate synthase [Hoeflea sp. BAL378]|uniref:imidazole glycerol phosphate synthase subunit HisH n=1 Tax=Hoeflea sp. BAL378 TaxID=1547437 RepID=UPI000513F38E|nr:imidazole glycerol phosphate synthase subunit HisH [Hoeflea sp. BAL378]KGF67313.1 imidazole glycerol phosphate synthase [Hoeflea sp. BAL378]
MIGVVDYGLGNVQAFLTAYRRMNIPAYAAKTPDELSKASKVILPGVGSFDHAMDLLNQSGLKDPLLAQAKSGDVPILGVCVGMQILADGSDEGVAPGLGLVPGRVRTLVSLSNSSQLPMPHMGWNDVQPVEDMPLFAGLEDAPRFYFLHSYFYDCAHETDVAAHVTYGQAFTCAVRRDNVFGVQFHPEKSHDFGSRLLRNFAEL